MADVPLGMFLSGGIDSSAVAALMAREVNRPIDTFSVAFADRAFSELEYAREVARAVGATQPRSGHRRSRLLRGTAPARVARRRTDRAPLQRAAPLRVDAGRQHVKVVLTGEGSDELLAGYGKYPRALLNWRAGGIYERLVPSAVRSLVAGAVVPRIPARSGATRAAPSWPCPAGRTRCCSTTSPACRCTRNGSCWNTLACAGDPYAPSLEYFTRVNGANGMLGRLLYTDVKTYLVELLMKQDQMSMSASIESRVPFLDHVLVEFAARLPERLKLRGFTTKRILREAMRGRAARADPDPAEDGLPGAVRAVDAGRLERRRRRTCCSIDERASAA